MPVSLTHCPADVRAYVCDEVLLYDFLFIESPRLVLDLGAHAGAFTALVRERWPDARVVACEPDPINADCYRKNFPGTQYSLLEAAARSFEGRAELRRGLNSGCHSFHDLGQQNGELIPVRCLDAATLPAADLIKIDTEGCELEILQRIDLSAARTILLEYHRAEDERAIRAFLQAKGFRLHDAIRHTANRGLLKYGRRIVENRLMVAVPIYDRPNPFFTQALLSVLADPPCHVMYRQTVGDSPVGRSRNSLTGDLLESDCSHILFIDCDLIFSRQQVGRILACPEPVVGGLYPKKQAKLEWVINTLPGATVREDGLHEVAYMGTGFIRIARTVFEQMIAKWGDEIRYRCDQNPHRIEYNLWPIGTYTYPDGSRRYLSEDWYFCQRWRDLGGKVWADTHIILKHVGWTVFPLDESFLRAAQGGVGSGSPDAARP